MTRWIEYEGLDKFLPETAPHLHIDKFDLYLEGVFRYQSKDIFRIFMQTLAEAERALFTTKGRNSSGFPYFQIAPKRYLFSSPKIDYSHIGSTRCTIRFPLICNLTRFIAHHPNGIDGGLSLEDILRHPLKFRNCDIPEPQRISRWFQYNRARKVCLDREDNILRGVRYMQCDNVAERFHEYVSLIRLLIEERINHHTVQTERNDITFAWDDNSMLVKNLEAYHDYRHPNALALVRSLHRNLEHLSPVVDTRNYVTERNIDAFSIALPLRDETNMKCVFYAKTQQRVRIELRYQDNLRQLINRLPHPAANMPDFISRILHHAANQMNYIYAPLRTLLAGNRLPVTTSLSERYTRFFYALNTAAKGNEDVAQELLTLLIENSSIAVIPRNKRGIIALIKAGVVEEASIRPGNKNKTCLPKREYRALIAKLRMAGSF